MAETLLEMKGISKAFAGVLAIHDVDFTVRRGEIHCLIGENGAGKSTLMKILAGAYQMDAGEIRIDGQPVHISGPLDAIRQGISIVYQELKVVPTLNVAENIFLGRIPSRGVAGVNWNKLYGDARAVISSLGFDLDPTQLVSDLSVAQQQMVEIAKALSLNARIIVMDEPSSALTPGELQRLFQVLKSLAGKGVSVIYISHRLDELFVIGDRATVLKDGALVGTVEMTSVQKEDIIRMMVGREVGKNYPLASRSRGDTLLEVRGLNRRGILHDVDLTLHRGEILGIAGLVGSGRTELVRAIFGADSRDGGEIILSGQPLKIGSPRDAVGHGIGFVTENRRDHGLVLIMSVRENLTLTSLKKRFSRTGIVDAVGERAAVREFVGQLSIKAASMEQEVQALSGGNQQKVVLGKWLATGCRVFIFDEPTKGVDVGAKEEIYHLMRGLAEQGAGVLMISSELPEVLGMSDHILVMHEGRVVGELARAEATEEKIMTLAVGGRNNHEKCVG